MLPDGDGLPQRRAATLHLLREVPIAASDEIHVPLDHALDITHLQRRVRALCLELGMTHDATYRWMLAFAELACALVPLPTRGARVALRPLRRRGASGVEMRVEAPNARPPAGSAAWRWMDECSAAPARQGWTRLVARKWEKAPA